MSNLIILAIIFCSHLLLSVNCGKSEQYYWKENYLEVPLDHFGYASNKTFQLRYLTNNTYAEDEKLAPILFYTGNEGDIELFAQNTGFIWELAPNLRASIVFAEHRYYGKSLPFGNDSLSSRAHFGYLTAEQALADYAQLLDVLNNGTNNRPVIAIGGSYGGMLAAWFRMKYPHHVTGALAASAPIWQFTDLTPCNIFTQIITSVFDTALTTDSGACSSNIKRSWDVLKTLSTSDSGRAFLNSQFGFCKNMSKPEEIDDFFDFLEDVYGNLAMANYPYENDFLAPLPAYPVRQFCMYLSKVHKNDTELIQAMQQAINVYTNFTGSAKCLDYKSAYEPDLGGNAWDIQICNEMVMPMCSGGDRDMFRKKDWDIKAYSDKCFSKYEMRPRPREILTRFGGYNIDYATNIIFSNGLLDPWSGGGVLKTSNGNVNIIIIPEGAHHIDLRSSNPMDPSSVRETRKRERKIIQSWIEEYFAEK